MKKIIAIVLSLLFVFNTVVIDVNAIDQNDVNNNETNIIDGQDEKNIENTNEIENSEKTEKNELLDIDESNDKDSNLEDGETDDIDNDGNQEIDDSIEEPTIPNVSYSTHVQDFGWQGYSKNGENSGSTGRSKRIEGIKIKIEDTTIPGGITYSTHVQNLGWTDYVSDDTLSGTTGKSLRLEAIKIKLTGELANQYDVYYRVHTQNYGWLDWTSNGKAAGSAGYSYRLEAIQIVLVKKGENVPGKTSKPFVSPGRVYYSTHVQDIGWMSNVSDGKTSGTSGKSKQVEALKISLDNFEYDGNIEYSSNVKNKGWQNYCKNGSISGTTGQELQIEGIKIRLTGDIANYYDVYYRVHVQELGWLSWAKNDEKAGTSGYDYRIEAIQVVLVSKNGTAPGDISTAYKTPGDIYYSTHVADYGWLGSVGDGSTSGLLGKSKQVEAIKLNLGDVEYSGGLEYRTHIQNIGWQSYCSDGMISGTTGENLHIEAIQIRLRGDIANYYDVYYRVQVQNYGWLSWAKNDEKAGSEGLNARVEAIQVILVLKGQAVPGDTNKPFLKSENIYYFTHMQDYGWQNKTTNGATGGIIGQNKRLEAIKISVNTANYTGNVEYSVHVQDYGWQNYTSNGQIAGTMGQSKRIEAIKIRLTGEIANYNDVYYRVYCQNIGWLDWTNNDNPAGTIGASYRIEAIQIKLYPKGIGGPGVSNKACLTFKNKNGYLVCYNSNGQLCEDIQQLYTLQGTYDLRVNKATNVVTVLAQDGNGKNTIAYKRFVCSVGLPTPTGVYYTPAKYRWRELMGPSYGQYSTRIVNGFLFHSVPYNKMNIYTLSARMYNQLGSTCSHGCIRLTCRDAKWIYDYCPLGTKVIIVDGGPDPLSKPIAQKIPLTQTWDPTDPAI